MDDLISRKAALDAMCEYLNQPIHRGSRRWTKGCEAVSLDLLFTVNGVPSVPAVPLDKLCEWLGKFANPCKIGIRCYYPYDNDCDCMPTVECWRYVLTKRMEGLDAAD